MLYIFHEDTGNNMEKILAIHPADTLSDRQKSGGVEIEAFPELPPIPAGHIRTLYVVPSTGEIVPEDVPDSEESLLKRLNETEKRLRQAEARLAQTDEVILSMMFGGMM